MQINVAIDPTVLALNLTSDPDEVKKRLKCIRTWREIQNKFPWVHLMLPKGATSKLQAVGAYPSPIAVRKALQDSNLGQVFSVNDVSRQIDELLRCNHLEDHISFTDALWTEISIEPPLTECSPDLEYETSRLLVLTLLHSASAKASNLSIASMLSTQEVRVRAETEMIIPETVPGFRPNDLPKTVAGTVANLTSFEDVFDQLDPLDVWSTAKTTDELLTAIKLKMRSVLKRNSEYQNWQSIPNFFIGEDFRLSLQAAQAAGDATYSSVTAETCAFAILRIPTLTVKPFRVTENSPEQRTRGTDGAKAFRVHITGSGLALRLMYWERADKTIELANVGIKAELKICEGNPGRATH